MMEGASHLSAAFMIRQMSSLRSSGGMKKVWNRVVKADFLKAVREANKGY